MSSKSAIRAAARERLSTLTDAMRIERGERIARRVWSVPGIEAARVVLLYASLPTEVPTIAIAAEARRRGIEVSYPRCLPEGQMSLHIIGAEEELVVAGSYGIREPAPECRLTSIDEIDVALIPGLAWDRSGNRLGRGAGYYDRLFAHPLWRARRTGLFFALQEFPAIPTDPWDGKLDEVVTEGEVVEF